MRSQKLHSGHGAWLRGCVQSQQLTRLALLQVFAQYRNMPIGDRPADNNRAKQQKWIILTSQATGVDMNTRVFTGCR
jgi:hypothetical protein